MFRKDSLHFQITFIRSETGLWLVMPPRGTLLIAGICCLQCYLEETTLKSHLGRLEQRHCARGWVRTAIPVLPARNLLLLLCFVEIQRNLLDFIRNLLELRAARNLLLVLED